MIADRERDKVRKAAATKALMQLGKVEEMVIDMGHTSEDRAAFRHALKCISDVASSVCDLFERG